jgi:type I restriction enzyme R subunit
MISELHGVEQPVRIWLSQMGWQYCSTQDLKAYNRPFSNPLIDAIFLEKVQEINKVDAETAGRVLELFKNLFNIPDPLLGNETILSRLSKGITLTINGQDRDIQLINFKDPWQNSFIVTQQYWVQGMELVKPDIVLLVNGIPIVPIEAKQRARQSVNYLEGVRQFSTYAQRAPKLFMTHAFGVACNGRIAKFGIPGVTSSSYYEWNDTSLDDRFDNPLMKENILCKVKMIDGVPHADIPEVERMKACLVGLLQPTRVLDILKNFIVFEKTDEGTFKKVARYQQLRAANKILHRVAHTDLPQGVIWHTQGSGKSLTMLFAAYKLRNDESLNDPTVYIVVDRKDLRTQIGDTFEDCDFPNTFRPATIGQLKAKIQNQSAEVIITTVQKFRELGDVIDPRANIIVMVDEAHRTEYGDFQSELKRVFPNSRRFAFTGTPIPKTHREFGIKIPEGKFEYFLDQYSIVDSIADGATVKIRYTFGPQEWFLDKDKLKAGWEEIATDLDEEQRQAVQRRVQLWKVFLKHPDRITTLAKDIAEDFRNGLEPLGFKAQLVACDREACVLYYNELLKYFDPSEIAIVFSRSANEEAEQYEMFKDHYLEEGELKKLIKRFRRRITDGEKQAGNNLKILIVCNMLITGFDAPIEQTMYLDSPLRDHNLLQAIARTNRPYEDKVTEVSKKFGRVVDYIGVFQNYNEALNYDPADIGEFEDVDSLVRQFPDLLQTALTPFVGIALEDSYECSIEIIHALSNIDQIQFEKNFQEVVQLYEAVSPHPELLRHKELYRWLLTIYEIYLEEFKRLDFDAEIYAAKTRKLIQESTTLLRFHGHMPEIEIDEKYIQNLEQTQLTPEDKAEKIIRDIETVIRRNELESPVYVEYQNRLEELIRQKEKKTFTIVELLKDLAKLYQELDEVASLPERLGFSERCSFDVFIEIKNRNGGAFDETLGKAFAVDLVQTVKKKVFIGWQDSDKEMNRMRLDIQILASSDLYQGLDIDTDEELVSSILKRIVQHYGMD